MQFKEGDYVEVRTRDIWRRGRILNIGSAPLPYEVIDVHRHVRYWYGPDQIRPVRPPLAPGTAVYIPVLFRRSGDRSLYQADAQPDAELASVIGYYPACDMYTVSMLLCSEPCLMLPASYVFTTEEEARQCAWESADVVAPDLVRALDAMSGYELKCLARRIEKKLEKG